MSSLVVHAERFPALGSPEGTFCLVTNPELVNHIHLISDGGYRDCRVVPWTAEASFEQLLATQIPEPAGVVVLSPRRLFRSPPDIARRKVIVFATASTPVSLDVLGHFVAAAGRISPEREEQRATSFFERAREAELLQINDLHLGARARFWHLEESYEWHQQAGPLDWGDQQVAPSGELSVTPGDIMKFDGGRRLAVTGTLALHGPVIIHGDATDGSRSDQSQLHAALDTLQRHPVMVTLEIGEIVSVRAVDPGGQAAAEALDKLLAEDPRYRMIQEIGFGINDSFEVVPGNVGMNEPYGGSHGVVHFGLGLTPTTRFALTFLAPRSVVIGKDGEVLIGDPAEPTNKRMMVQKKPACACIE